MRHSISQPVRAIVVGLCIALCFIISCGIPFVGNTEVDIDLQNRVVTELSSIPFTEQYRLDQIDTADPDIIPWELSRAMAYIDFRSSSAEEFGWESATLSDRPVVVYDKDSRPLFYEFIVHTESEQALGTITAYAQKDSVSAVSHILPYVRDYSFLQTKSSDYAQVASYYPRHVLVGIPGKSGDAIGTLVNPETGAVEEPLEFGTNIDEHAEKYRSMSPEELYEVARIDHAELEQQIIEYKLYLNRQERTVESYWAQVDSRIQELVIPTDAEIDAMFQDTKIFVTRNHPNGDIHERRVLRSVDTRGHSENSLMVRRLYSSHWGLWCVPSAVAWAYRLFYTHYNGQYLPLGKVYYYNDPNDRQSNSRPHTSLTNIYRYNRDEDGGLYYELAKEGDLKSDGVVEPLHKLSHIIEHVTGERNYALIQFAGYTRAHDQIYRKGKPIFVDADLSPTLGHLFVLAGSYKKIDRWQALVLFWWVDMAWLVEHQRYLVIDNGYLTRNPHLVGGRSEKIGNAFWVDENVMVGKFWGTSDTYFWY